MTILRICLPVNQLGTKGDYESGKRLTVQEDAVRCVHLNPVSKGLCSDMMEYRWSSARAVLFGELGRLRWIEVSSMSGRLFTDKLVFRWWEVHGARSLDSATPATSAYSAHASGSSCLFLSRRILQSVITNAMTKDTSGS